MRLFSRLMIGLAALVVLALAALAVAPYVVDWNGYKGRVAREVERLTGERVAIDGDVSFRLLPTPMLSARRVRLLAATTGTAEPIARVGLLQARIGLAPLLGGDLEVETLSLFDPVVSLPRLQEAERSGSRGKARSSSSGLFGEVQLNRIAVEDGTLIYRGARGVERRIEDLDLQMSGTGGEGAFRVAGTGLLAQQPAEFELAMGQIPASAPVPLKVRLALPGARAVISLTGEAAQTSAGPRLTGNLKVETEDLAALVLIVDPEVARHVPAGPDRALVFDGAISATNEQIDLNNIFVQLGATMATGHLSLRPGSEPLELTAALEINGLNLDDVLERFEAPTTAEPLLAAVDAKVELKADTVAFRGGVLTRAELTAQVRDGRLEVTKAAALFPGSTELSAAGLLAPAPDGLTFTGTLDGKSDDLRTFLGWLQVDLAEVPPDRFRRARLATGLKASAGQVALSDMQLQLDSSTAKGEVGLRIGSGPAYRLAVSIDQLNLDAYLPPVSGESPQLFDATGPPRAILALLDPLSGHTGEIDLGVEALTYRGQAIRKFHLAGAIENGEVVVRELKLQDLAGADATIHGRAQLSAEPAFEASFVTKAPDADAFLRTVGLPTPGAVRLGTVSLDGTVRGTVHRLEYRLRFAGTAATGEAQGTIADADGAWTLSSAVQATLADARVVVGLGDGGEISGRALEGATVRGTFRADPRNLSYEVGLTLPGVDGTVTSKGAVQGWRDEPDVDLALQLAVRNSDALFAVLGLDAGIPAGPVSVSGTAKGRAEKLRVALGLGLLGGTAEVSGIVDAVSRPLDFDLAVEAKLGDAAPVLGALVGLAEPEIAALDPLVIETEAVGTVQNIELREFVLGAGRARLRGTAGFDRTGPRPKINADLRGNLLPAEVTGAVLHGSGPGGAPLTWWRTPLDLSAMEGLDAEVTLALEGLQLGSERLAEVAAQLSLERGVLVVDHFEAQAFGGAISASGRLAGAGIASAAAKVLATDIAVSDLLPDGFLGHGITGPVTFQGNLTSSGISPAEMFEGLEGTAAVTGVLTLTSKDGAQRLEGWLDSLHEVPQSAAQAENIRTLYQALVASPNAVTANFLLQHGMLSTEDAYITNDQVQVRLHGAAQLALETLQLAVEVFRHERPEWPALVIDIAGPVSDPRLRLVDAGQEGHSGLAPNGSPQWAPPETLPQISAGEESGEEEQPEPEPESEEPDGLFDFPEPGSEHALPDGSHEEPEPGGTQQPQTEQGTVPLITD